MNGLEVILVSIFMVISIVVVSVLSYLSLYRKSKEDLPPESNKNLEENIAKIAQMMEDDRLKAEQEKRDKELSDYSSLKLKQTPTGGIFSSGQISLKETPVNIKSHDLVPYGLSDRDRAILEEFYGHN